MDTKGSEFSTPLLSTNNGGVDFQGNRQREASPISLTLILSTLTAVFGSYGGGFCVTVGAMTGSIVSGKIADYAGRRVTMGFSELLTLPFIPDSPRWLRVIMLYSNSEESMLIYQEATEIKDYTEALQHQTEASIIGLFQSQYLKTLTVGVGLMILQQFGGVSGFLFYTNSIFISAGFWDSLGTIATVAVKVPLTTLGVLLMDKCGRRPLLLEASSQLYHSS
ncbi:Sugar transporter ERD6-like 5 [Glycine soja]|nr:Sugar transporter ERD6-like 5 [Glycine soja]